MDNWFTIEQIDRDTFSISEYKHWEETHCYLLCGEKCAILIDTGLGVSNIRKIVDSLTELPVMAVTTHVHWDHIGGHKYFDNIAVHEEEKDWLSVRFPIPLQVVKNNLTRLPCDFPKDFDINAYQIFQGMPQRILHDGDFLNLGEREIQVIHTPGHSPGHCCFYEPKRNYLYSGDLIYKGSLDAFYPTTDPQLAPELFEAAQHIRTSRANSAEQERRVPLNTRGQSLLAGNVFCGHCGSRLALTTNGKAYPCKEDAHRIVKRVRYICYGKTRKQAECDGQTGYTAHILDGIIDKVVRQIFERMKAIPKSEIVNIRYREKMEERKALLKSTKSDYAKAAAELDTLRAEVIKSLRGESAFPQDLLSSLISDCETKCLEVQRTMEAAQTAYDEGQAMLDALNAQYDDIISWAEMYDSASMESKKMIVSCLIRRVEVYRDYRLHIDFNIDFEQFSAGLDISAIAA